MMELAFTTLYTTQLERAAAQQERKRRINKSATPPPPATTTTTSSSRVPTHIQVYVFPGLRFVRTTGHVCVVCPCVTSNVERFLLLLPFFSFFFAGVY